MICENCGKMNKDGVLFCSECGKAFNQTPIDLELEQLKIPAASRKSRIIKVNATRKSENVSQATPADETDNPAEGELIEITPPPAAAAPAEEQTAQAPQQNELPRNVAPMKIRNWIPVFILSAIPVLNFIMLLIWAISSSTNKSKKSFAITALIFMGISLVLGVGLVFVYAALFQVNLSSFASFFQ